MQAEVKVVNVTPNPARTACLAARNDYLTEWVGEVDYEEVMEPVEGDSLGEKQENLIHDLLQRGHYGPFEHVNITFSLKGVSRVLMAQLTRHRHASFDVQSLRYTAPDLSEVEAMYRGDEPVDNMRNYVVVPELMEEIGCVGNYLNECLNVFHRYAEYVENSENIGVPKKRAKEDARFLLPMGTKVNIVFTVNARMLMHIADMRAAGDAQWEIRQVTDEILDEAHSWFPEAFNYYVNEMKGRKNRLAP